MPETKIKDFKKKVEDLDKAYQELCKGIPNLAIQDYNNVLVRTPLFIRELQEISKEAK